MFCYHSLLVLLLGSMFVQLHPGPHPGVISANRALHIPEESSLLVHLRGRRVAIFRTTPRYRWCTHPYPSTSPAQQHGEVINFTSSTIRARRD
uniref:Putative secreted peptide n=1 Tax=Anopheles braziliensis TaxID=58242 RepID=A0A2M3ZWN4_9DIPT